MFSIENSIPKQGKVILDVETARINNLAREFENAMDLLGEDTFRHLCFDEPIQSHIFNLKQIIENLSRIKDVKKKKNMVGYFYVCLEEIGYMTFKIGETLSHSVGAMNTSKFYEYVRLALMYRKEEWTHIHSGENVKDIVLLMEVQRNEVEDARLEMESVILKTL